MTRSRRVRAINRMRRDARGAVLVEFALLLPVFLTLLFGVLQVGLHVQNTNAVRNLASDGARFAVVQYQLDRLSAPDLIETRIRSMATSPKYGLSTDRLTITVTQAATSRIPGSREMTIQILYDAPDFLAFVDGDQLQISYSRPVFLLIPAPPPAPAT